MAGLNIDWSGFATLSKMDMQQCPKIFCNFVQKVLAKNNSQHIGGVWMQHYQLEARYKIAENLNALYL